MCHVKGERQIVSSGSRRGSADINSVRGYQPPIELAAKRVRACGAVNVLRSQGPSIPRYEQAGGIMEPSALLVTMNRYRGVARRLRDIEAGDFPGVHVHVKSVHGFEDIPPLLRSGNDLIALDGHGWTDGPDAYFGTGKVFTQFCTDYLRGEKSNAIVAPIVVLAFCHGREDPFLNAIEKSIDRNHVAFLGSTRSVAYDDYRIYPPLLTLLAQLGSNPDPATAYEQLESIAPDIGAAWRPALLERRCE